MSEPVEAPLSRCSPAMLEAGPWGQGRACRGSARQGGKQRRTRGLPSLPSHQLAPSLAGGQSGNQDLAKPPGKSVKGDGTPGLLEPGLGCPILGGACGVAPSGASKREPGREGRLATWEVFVVVGRGGSTEGKTSGRFPVSSPRLGSREPGKRPGEALLGVVRRASATSSRGDEFTSHTQV